MVCQCKETIVYLLNNNGQVKISELVLISNKSILQDLFINNVQISINKVNQS